MAKWGRLGHFSGPTVQHKVKPDFHILTHRLVKQIERHMDKCHIGTKANSSVSSSRLIAALTKQEGLMELSVSFSYVVPR